MTSAERFWDRAAERYARRPVKNVAAYEKTLERTRAHLSPGDEVLELGCGTGTTALKLAGSVKRLTASDISAAMIGIAKRKAREDSAANVDFVKATLFDGGLAGREFDAVLAFNFLHLLEDPAAGLRRVRELLKPGGVFISKTVCLGEMSRVWRPVIYLMRKVGLAPDVRFLSIPEVESLIAGEGFRIVETGTYPASPPARFVVARRIDAA